MKAVPHKTKNDLPQNVRGKMIELLNQQLADVLDLGLQAKQAHWNVKGPHFIGLHELFDKVAEELKELTDDMAERAVELGGVAFGTIQIISKKSRLSSYPLDLASGQKHVAALSSALANCGASTTSSPVERSKTVRWSRRIPGSVCSSFEALLVTICRNGF